MNEFHIGAQDRVNASDLKPYIDKILQAIGIKWALLTDRSCFIDFGLIIDDLRVIAEELGLESIDENDFIWEVALRMKNECETGNSDTP